MGPRRMRRRGRRGWLGRMRWGRVWRWGRVRQRGSRRRHAVERGEGAAPARPAGAVGVGARVGVPEGAVGRIVLRARALDVQRECGHHLEARAALGRQAALGALTDCHVRVVGVVVVRDRVVGPFLVGVARPQAARVVGRLVEEQRPVVVGHGWLARRRVAMELFVVCLARAVLATRVPPLCLLAMHLSHFQFLSSPPPLTKPILATPISLKVSAPPPLHFSRLSRRALPSRAHPSPAEPTPALTTCWGRTRSSRSPPA